LQNWPKVEVLFSKNLHTTPLELDQLAFYRVEEILNAYEEIVEEENKSQNEEQKKYEKQAQLAQPEYGGFKVPKMDLPKMDLPKMPKL
jgi:hypothetical protein